MENNKKLISWKNPLLLLFGIGVSNIGDWIYLIALNLIILDMTKSVMAISILYVLKPLATLLTNLWAGSLIDRMNKRNLMVILDVLRGLLILLLPSISSLYLIFGIVFIVNMASSIFYPTSITYITKLIPKDMRLRFNALRSLVQSGGFLTGPAIAGLLFMIGTPKFAIYINALSFIISGILTACLPNLDELIVQNVKKEKLTFRLIKKDFTEVLRFSRKSSYVMTIYFLFNGLLVLTAGVDSLEAVFSKTVLHLSNTEYGILVSIAGAGIGIGAIINTFFSKQFQTSWLLGIGTIFVSIGYIIYSYSNTFSIAALGFFILSFSLSFANTGFDTFYQSNVNTNIMGRVGSIYGFVEAVLVISTTILIGLSTHFITVKISVITGSLMMLFLALLLGGFILRPSGDSYFRIIEYKLNSTD
ncbi:MFS transporter [Gottfriedia luciferensis]|uniref:MFS transporter n=1 Tax=Gottfriedia luciferensis TaxID=178774 RepID=UPI000B44BA84|nr:MFS transporter [Gottfriedia luciferensis]